MDIANRLPADAAHELELRAAIAAPAGAWGHSASRNGESNWKSGLPLGTRSPRDRVEGAPVFNRPQGS